VRGGGGGRSGELFEKKFPCTPQKLSKKKQKRSPLQLLLTLYGEGRASFQAIAPATEANCRTNGSSKALSSLTLRTPKTRPARFREPQPLGIHLLRKWTPSPDPYRESKNSCQQQPHLGRAIYAPKMEDGCQSKSPAGHCQNGGRQGVPRGNVLVSFLATSWETPRSSIKKRSAQRAARRSRGGLYARM